MNRYENGKIYIIRSEQTEQVYVGSTCLKYLSTRLSKHKTNYKRWLNKKGNYAYSFELLKYTDCKIELLELYPCSCKEELLKRETEFMKLNNCVNKNLAQRTNKQYYEDHKQKYKIWRDENKLNKKDYDKQRYLKKKSEISQKNKEKIFCEACKKYITKGAIRRHNKSKKHLNNLK